jgi:hypothetical protein
MSPDETEALLLRLGPPAPTAGLRARVLGLTRRPRPFPVLLAAALLFGLVFWALFRDVRRDPAVGGQDPSRTAPAFALVEKPEPWLFRNPVWRPDRKQVVLDDGKGIRVIWLKPPVGEAPLSEPRLTVVSTSGYVAYSPDSIHLAVLDGKELRIHESDTLGQVYRHQFPDQEMPYRVRFVGPDLLLVVRFPDERSLFRRVQRAWVPEPRIPFEGTRFEVSPDGKWFVHQEQRGNFDRVVLEVGTWKRAANVRMPIQVPGSIGTHMTFSADSKYLAVEGSSRGEGYPVNYAVIETGSWREVLRGQYRPASGISFFFTGDSRHLILGAVDRVRAVRCEDGSEVASMAICDDCTATARPIGELIQIDCLERGKVVFRLSAP